jgi:hypothetical protein
MFAPNLESFIVSPRWGQIFWGSIFSVRINLLKII